MRVGPGTFHSTTATRNTHTERERVLFFVVVSLQQRSNFFFCMISLTCVCLAILVGVDYQVTKKNLFSTSIFFFLPLPFAIHLNGVHNYVFQCYEKQTHTLVVSGEPEGALCTTHSSSLSLSLCNLLWMTSTVPSPPAFYFVVVLSLLPGRDTFTSRECL